MLANLLKRGVIRCTGGPMQKSTVSDPTEKGVRMAKKKAPKGFKAFDELTRKLVEIPKGEVDQQVAKSKTDRLRRKRRKKK